MLGGAGRKGSELGFDRARQTVGRALLGPEKAIRTLCWR
jgi:hypothetical protein